MAQRGRRSARSSGDWSRPPRRRPPPGLAPRRDTPPGFVRHVRRLLSGDDPLPLIAHVSELIAAIDPRAANPFDDPGRGDLPDLRGLTRSLIRIDVPETSVVLALIAAMGGDPAAAAEARTEVRRRGHTLPEWLTRLDEVTAERTLVTTHVLGDAEDVIISARLASGHDVTAFVYVDHNLGTVTTDGFLLAGAFEGIERLIHDAADPDTGTAALTPAEARARVEQAIRSGAMAFPPYETETWPAVRPAVEWLVRKLPAGGTGYERREWTDGDRTRLAEEFFASKFGAPLDNPDTRELIDSLLWFGTDYASGDPDRWSPVSVEILLLDWLPRKIVAEPEFLAGAPPLLAALVRFGHERCGVPEHLTEQTLAAIRDFTPGYLAAIRSPRLQGPLAILGAMGAIDPDDADLLTGGEPGMDLRDIDDLLRELLRYAVGGDAALRSLDVAPLPDEPFRWTGIPDDVHDRVAEVLALTDACCDALMDTECRTAARRFLASVARGDPRVFRRRARPETAAAAVMWIIGHANHMLGYRGGVRAGAIADNLGLASIPTQRARTLLIAAGHEPWDAGSDASLGSPEYLTSRRRAAIIGLRDRLDL
jgi:hypothetical protein